MLIFYLDLEISRKKPYFMFNSLKWRNFGWIPVILKVAESFLIPKLKTNKMSTTRRASILTRQGRHLIIYRVEGSRIMAHLNHHFSAVMYTYVLSIVRLISTNWPNGQLGPWSAPWSGELSLSTGWWAPVAQCHKRTVGARAQDMRFTVPASPTVTS